MGNSKLVVGNQDKQERPKEGREEKWSEVLWYNNNKGRQIGSKTKRAKGSPRRGRAKGGKRKREKNIVGIKYTLISHDI